MEGQLMLTNRRRNALAFSSSLAIATALAAAPQAAGAQSFQGNSTVVSGSATVSTGTNTTTVDVASPQAVINWTPFDTATSTGTPISFQPAGTTATFQSTGDFAVLNRILPSDASRPVVFDGNVISQIQGTTTTPGGTVYFYSPGGIIVGANAVFDVGNLGLTTSPVAVDGNGNWYNSVSTPIAGRQVQFGQAASGSSVQIQSGAQITASAEGSYIAAFSPYIVQNGTINVNGQAALVAAEAGTLTFNPFAGFSSGLIDIEVSIGTDGQGGVGISHGGTTTGPASSGAGDLHRVYMVAIPKNTAISLLFERGSSVGFDVAGAANIDGNAVVLSAGQTLRGDAYKTASWVDGGNIQINDSNTGLAGSGIDFTSKVIAVATDNLNVDVFRQTNFASDALLVAEDLVQVAVGTIPGDPAGSLSVGGKLVLDTDFGRTAPAGRDGGISRFFVSDGATASVAGDMLVRSLATKDRNGDGIITGGDALVYLDGGAVTVGGELRAEASAFINASGVPGEAHGGNSQVLMFGGSTASVGGDLQIRAQGLTDGATSAIDATGGSAELLVSEASNASVAGVTRLRSEGVSAFGANATGGYSGLRIDGASHFATNELNVSADADGLAGGATAAPGTAQGGLASIGVFDPNSSLTVQAGNSTGDINIGELDLLSAEAFAGAGNAPTGAGGNAQGGTAQFVVANGAVANLPADPGEATWLRIFARAYGGDTFATGGTGGAATGGNVSLVINGGTLNSGNLLLPSSFAQGGSADVSVTGAANGGNAVGGIRDVTIINGTLNGSFAGGGPGAQGGNGSLLGTGGNGTGGTSNFFMNNGTITATTDAYGISRVIAFAQNAGGSGATGGSASGGVTNVTIQNGSVITVNPDANGVGGVVTFNAFNTTPDLTDQGAISSGDATGGTVNVAILNSQINAAEFAVYSDARSGWIATSGGAGPNARTGNATGGTATLNLNGATIDAGSVIVEAFGEAGSSEDSGTVNAGSGTGGAARIFANGAASTITTDELTVRAYGTGGTIYSGLGNGGNASGGRALLQANSGAVLTVNSAATDVSANANGGSALFQGRGGDASSGFAEASAVGGGTLLLNGNLVIATTAEGGDGSVAGLATAQVQILPNDVLPNAILYASNGSVTVSGFTSISADSYGGAGLLGGAGGDAQAGLAVVNSDNNVNGQSSISLQSLEISADAYGGDGGFGLSGGTGGAGGNASGGEVDAFAGAGNGSLTVAGAAYLHAAAEGGAGGDGGSGPTGGTGGAGGSAVGGLVVFGTLSRSDTGTVNTGNASFTDVIAFSDANGGVGGAGGTGSNGDGNGGAGGDATGGASVLLVRGSTVTTTGQVTMAADAFGGDGGSGAAQGVGGDATIGGDGGVAVFVTSRFEHPEQRGFLDAADIFGVAQAVGGLGSADGASIVAGSPISIEVSDSELSADLFSLYASGEQQAGATPSRLTVTNGTADIGELSMSTPGDLLVSLDNSTVNAGFLYLDAGNFVLPASRPTTLGTFNVASGIQVFSDLDFLSYANFVLPFDVSFDLLGSFLTGDLTVNGSIEVVADSAITTGSIAATNVNLSAGQGVTAGAVNSAFGVYVVAGGAASLGDVMAGGTTPGAGKVAIASPVSVTTGAIRSTGDLGIQTAGSIATGNLIGRDVLLLTGGSLNTGSILAASGTQANGAIYFGNSSMASSNTNVFMQFRGEGGLLPIFQAAPVAIGGSATFGGSIQGGSLTGSSHGALSAQAITAANFIQLETGGLASVNGAWRSPDIELVSSDIAIASGGSLDALSSDGTIDLASTNTGGITVGDGFGTSTGYRLDNSEFGRIRAGEIVVVGIDGAQATDMTIGNLSITGSQLYGDGGNVVFATGDRLTEMPGGILRIAGAVNTTGFGSANEIDLLAGTVELEAANGSLKVSDGQDNLGGLVYIEANNIHVASDAILTKLRADPLYQGHITDLNTPLAVARPDGVLNALGLELNPGQTLFVQNTGTAAVPAGFLTTLDNSEINAPETPPAGGVEVVINGQFRTDTGTVTGRAAFDLVQTGAAEEPDAFAGFSESSQLNGCLFVGGTCAQTQTTDPVASISSEISVVTSATLDDSPDAPAADDADEGGDGAGEDEDDGGDSGAAPISPPAPLINTRPLNPDANVVEPVAGAGNPALLGSAVDEGIKQGETP
jgi:filamentous hemagglutinin family protein